jgi:hypothetical protein
MKKLLLLFMSATLLMACSDDDNNNTQPIEVHGAWTMTQYLAFAPEMAPLTDGQVVWVFNTNNTVTMSNQAAPYVSDNGTFNYHLEGDNAIVIHTEEGFELKYFYSFPEGKLRLESELASSDGPIMVFKKYTPVLE